MVEAQTWRELLGYIIRNSRERLRLAEQLAVSSTTLTRWSNGRSSPRPEHLHALLNALPHSREQFLKLIPLEFPGFLAAVPSQEKRQASGLAAKFYACVMDTYISAPLHIRAAELRTLILQEMLSHLDPQRLGLEILVMQCMPPDTQGLVKSLRLILRYTTSAPPDQCEKYAGLYGFESQCGDAVMAAHPMIVTNREEKARLYPVHQTEHEESSVALPIFQAGYIAGGLYAGSSQPHYFSRPVVELIQNYVNLLVLSFEPHLFYDPQKIKLKVLPGYEKQAPFLVGFQDRVNKKLIEAVHQERILTRLEAEALVWREMESEM